MALIDTHVHLYDVDRLHYDWLAGSGLPGLARSHSLDDYRAAAEGSGVDGFVFVEVDARPEEALDEARWVAAQAPGVPRLLGIVAAAPVASPTLTDHLDALADIPLVKGVRFLVQAHPDELMASPDFRRGLAQVGERGFTFDLCCRCSQLPSVIELVAATPGVPYVLDHLAKPQTGSGDWEPWASQLARLASFEHVVGAKLSGLYSEGPPEAAGRHLAHAVEVFGPGRLLFGSDWPLCDQAGSHRHWVDQVEEAISGLAAGEQEAVRSGNAARVYRLEPPGRTA